MLHAEVMQRLERLCSHGEASLEELLAQSIQLPFNNDVLAFIADFSNQVLKSPQARIYPEVVALGFWMRHANITRIKTAFETAYTGKLFFGRGVVFHIAPSNVDTLFIYSLFVALLAGNTNIMRISTKFSAQLACIISILDEVLQRHPRIAKRLLVIRYGHDDEVTAYLSSVCHLRLIWGGDDTVCRIRAIPLPPHAAELAFSGRFSVAVIDAEAWNAEQAQSTVAKAFCNDAFIFNQQGCSSPKLVYWCGSAHEVATAQASFWEAVEQVMAKMPAFVMDAATAMDRFVATCSIAIESKTQLTKIDARNHTFTRLCVANIDDVVRKTNTGNGLFYEYIAPNLDELLNWFDDPDQTVASFGIPEARWTAALRECAPKGICRIVRFGAALDFSPIWDGYDIIRSLVREITVTV